MASGLLRTMRNIGDKAARKVMGAREPGAQPGNNNAEGNRGRPEGNPGNRGRAEGNPGNRGNQRAGNNGGGNRDGGNRNSGGNDRQVSRTLRGER